MHRPGYERIVDELVSTLAERRRSRIDRHAAYVALARAILADEPSASQEPEATHQLDGFVTVASFAA